MAIVIEEEKRKRGGWFSFGVLLFVTAVLGVAVYYFFFKNQELLEVVLPEQLQSVDELSKIISFDPQKVISSSFFQSLRQIVPVLSPPPAGNFAPFGVF